MSIFHFTSSVLAASGDLALNLGKIVGIINAISTVLFFAALVMSSLMFATGRTEFIKYGLVGAGIGGLSWVIIQTLFQAVSPINPGIEMQAF
tara:strand:+ start:1855 stop:2130 length:276 start_codon:yes stop_codon:yes gene_type:complete